VGALCVAILIALGSLPLAEWLDAAIEWNRANPLLGGAIYLAACMIGSVLFLPGSWLAMTGGYLYGLPLGIVMAAIGGALGAFAAFMSSRTFARAWAFARLEGHPRLQALDKALFDQSFVIVLLTRLAVVIPYNVLNYLYGATGVKKMPYAVASALGLIPAMALWSYVGALASNFEDILAGNLETGTAGRVLFFVGLVAIIIAVIVVHRAASRVLKERLGE
jgi:uncharacterized membrane protein YdjX (TVP38/TMEM64 family)